MRPPCCGWAALPGETLFGLERARAPYITVASVPPPTTTTAPAPPSSSRLRRSRSGAEPGLERGAASMVTGEVARRLRTNSAHEAGRSVGSFARPRERAWLTAELRVGLIDCGAGSGLWIWARITAAGVFAE